MSDAANVRSIDALKELREALVTFGEHAQDAICATNLEIQRTLDWVANQEKHWKRRVRELEEETNKAKNDLIQRKYWSEGGRGPGYTEQEIAFRQAKRRLEEAQAKVENCKRWGRQLPQAIIDYRGPAGQLSGMLDANLKHSVAILDRRIAALEAYVAIAPPSDELPPADASPTAAATTSPNPF